MRSAEIYERFIDLAGSDAHIVLSLRKYTDEFYQGMNAWRDHGRNLTLPTTDPAEATPTRL